jgi:hypothetical protein
MPKSFSPEVKIRALELYIHDDKSAREIVGQLWEEFDVSVKATTIYMWARENDWDNHKTEVKTKAIEQVKESSGQRFVRIQQEHLHEYGQLRQKAVNDLDHLPFDKAFEAAKALDLGIKGERVVMEGMINLQFVQNVLGVLVEEISDEELLRKVAFRLKALIQIEEPSIV